MFSLPKSDSPILSSGSSSWFGVSEPRNSVAPLEVTVKFPLMVYISELIRTLASMLPLRHSNLNSPAPRSNTWPWTLPVSSLSIILPATRSHFPF